MRLLPEFRVSAVSPWSGAFLGVFSKARLEGVSGHFHCLGSRDTVSALTRRRQEVGFMGQEDTGFLSGQDFRTMLGVFYCPGIVLAADWGAPGGSLGGPGLTPGPSTFLASLLPLRGDFSPLWTWACTCQGLWGHRWTLWPRFCPKLEGGGQ